MTVYLDLSVLLSLNFITGIQRVVREVSRRLVSDPQVEAYILMRKGKEAQFTVVDNQRYLEYLDGKISRPKVLASARGIVTPETMKKGAVFYDMDAVWNVSPRVYRRAILYAVLRQNDIRVVTFLHDLLPITDARFFTRIGDWRFAEYLGATVNYADRILVSTRATQDELEKVFVGMEGVLPPVEVTGLGANLVNALAEGETEELSDPDLAGKRYVLMVGTIEPRKNHQVVLEAFERELFAKGLSLVIAGRVGWGTEELISKMKAHPLLGKQLFLYNDVSDADLQRLYRHAYLVAFASFNEGYGLPVVEALQYGVPVVCSDRAVMREVGQDCCRYCTVDNPDAWAGTIWELAQNEEEYRELKKRVDAFVPDDWDVVTERMRAALERTAKAPAYQPTTGNRS